MKRTIIFAIAITCISIAAVSKNVTEKKVPVLVKNALYNDYPEAKRVKWEISSVNDYKASFQNEGVFISIYYDREGNFIESDRTVEWKDVPLTGRMELYHFDKTAHITGTVKVTNNKHQDFYVVAVKSGLKHYDVLLDDQGNVISVDKN